MKISRHQGMGWSSRRYYFTILHSLFLIFLWSTVALATCQTTSIIASTPTSQFTVNNDGTVTDTKTGLMWKVCSEGQTWSSTPACAGTATTFTWQNALVQAQTVNSSGFAGFTDWRVPNKKELASIVEVQCVSPSINAAIFPATATTRYWSASPYAGVASNAWNASFSSGFGNVSSKSSTVAVRFVRGGQ